MDRRELDIKRLAKRLGLRVEAIDKHKTGHYHVTVSYGQANHKFIFPGSGSDHRWIYNKQAEIKRWIRDQPQGDGADLSSV